MKRFALVVVLVVAAALGACDNSDSSGSGPRQRAADPGSTTTTAPPAVLELATPGGFRHSFRVVGTQVGLGATQAVADVELANALDRRDTQGAEGVEPPTSPTVEPAPSPTLVG